jgi:carbonic anhydrase
VSAVVDETLTFPEDISINGGCKAWTQFAESHAFEVNFADADCSNLRISYDGYTYTLQQLHFHSPAEHTIGSGKVYR